MLVPKITIKKYCSNALSHKSKIYSSDINEKYENHKPNPK